MNRTILICLLCFLLCQLSAHAQEQQLELAFHKTTSLVFPYAIQSVDRGSGDILAQAPPHSGNVLQVKAARPGFQETNLTVITADGRLYSFTVSYADNPITTLLRLSPSPLHTTSVFFTGAALNQRQLENAAAQLAEDERFLYGVKDKAGGAKAKLEGIYIRGSTLFYRVVLTNASPVPYDLDFTRFTLRDRKQAKRTAAQEEELVPLYAYGKEDMKVEAGHRKVLVLALEKHNLNRHKELVLDLFEKNGGRHLRLKVRDRDILQACPLLLPDEADF